jgi:UDP-N-acetylmuramoyl-L-alanyl-D-glutamate--2,6-diaminopimelate ligase
MSKPSSVSIKQVLSQFAISDVESINVDECSGGITNDSRTVRQGDIFCAIIGHAQDGRRYIESAIKQGACLVLSECENEQQHGEINYFNHDNKQIAVLSFYQLNEYLFALASAYYQQPHTQMTMIGVTGTNGKTSTTQLLAQMFAQNSQPCAVIGTNGAGYVDEKGIHLTELGNTTPSATDLVQLFAKSARQGLSHLAMEVSSHAIEQKRVYTDVFDIAVYTNLSRDHLDYHGTMADYAAAKRKLFTNSAQQIAILNGDDEQAKTWLENWVNKQNLWVYGRSETIVKNDQFVSCKNVSHHGSGVNFVLATHLGDIDINSPLLGDFNIDNLLAVISVLLSQGASLEEVAQRVANISPIAGRMETFTASNDKVKSATAVVDYAHTPDALKKALIACKQHCHGQLHVVFGCGGDRDKGKRPLMAQAAEEYADCLVITNDNPRTEAPMSIITDMLSGLSPSTETKIIEDREQAVLTTLAKAKPDDVVLLAGKGHEDYIILGTEKIDYNERQVVKDFFNKLDSKQTDSSLGGKV